MPAPTDHADRRQQLAALAFELISRAGLEAASVRGLAAATGFSTTIVTHYFPNKRALLFAVYRYGALRAQERVDAALKTDRDNLRGCLEALLPIGKESRAGWRVNFAFWQLALQDAVFAREQQWWANHAQQTIAAVLTAGGVTGVAARVEARYLLTLLQGMAVRAALESGWSDAAQRQFLNEALIKRRKSRERGGQFDAN